MQGVIHILKSITICALLSAPLLAEQWQAPTCTRIVPSPAVGYLGGTGHICKDWTWVDPQGGTHTFPGTSSNYIRKKFIYGVAHFPDPATKQITDLKDIQASDGSSYFLSTTDGLAGIVSAKQTFYPKYKVLKVIYAAPGIGSTVVYTNGSGTGSTSSIGRSFDSGFGLKATCGISLGLDWSQSSSNEKTISIENSQSAQNQWTSLTDGIDHDQDIMEIWLNPAAEVTLTSAKDGSWALGNNPGDPATAQVGADIVHLTIGQLMGRVPIINEYILAKLKRDWPNGGALTGPGTDTDFHNIAKQNPYYALGHDFAANSFIPDPARFSLAKCSMINYLPANSTVQTSNYSVQSNLVNSNSTSASNSYSVKVSASIPGASLIELGASGFLTWTDTISERKSSNNSTSATIAITQPLGNWQGPVSIVAYTDNVYGTYLFTYAK